MGVPGWSLTQASDLRGRRVVVLGLGASGRAAARVCVAYGAEVIGVDMREHVEPIPGVQLQLGPHRRLTFLRADLIVVSPGVPSDQVDVVAAELAGVPIMGELGLAAALLAPLDPVIIGITGTNGKSTVTAFTGQLLRAAGWRPFVGGNLGDPLCNAVPEPGADPDWDIIVAECSSYQLERAGSFQPYAGVILNLTPDHLARHGTMAGYAAAKARLFANAHVDDLVLLPADPRVEQAVEGLLSGRAYRRGSLAGLPGIQVDGDTAQVALPPTRQRLAPVPDPVTLDLSTVPVPGRHNRWNAAVAAALCLEVGAPAPAVQAGLGALTALEHRMEIVHRGDVTWINDSKATNLDAARVGLEGLDGTAVVLLGGQAKGSGFADLAPLLRRHRAVITFGDDGPAIAHELTDVGLDVHQVDTMEQAIEQAHRLALPGDTVLLSPGCASFDHYDSFAQRGTIFRERVQAMLASKAPPEATP